MIKYPRPKVIISRCLEFDSCRYDGGIVKNSFIKKLSKHVEFVTVCPEVDIGMSVPRDPIQIVKTGNNFNLIQPATGKDFSKKITTFSNRYLKLLKDVDGFILKSRSPSCGIKDTKLFDNENKIIGRTSGFFAAIILDEKDRYAIESSDGLDDPSNRNFFLTKLFIYANFRQVKTNQNINTLLNFHNSNKLIFEKYNNSALIKMNKLIASDISALNMTEKYEQLLFQVFSRKLNIRLNKTQNIYPPALLNLS